MVAELSVKGAEKFGKLAKDLKQLGDKDLRKELYRGISRAVRPLTREVKKSTPRFLPRGYALELSKTLRIQTKKRQFRDPGITLKAVSKTSRGKERDLASLNRGRLRHPLYGDRHYWYDQKVSPNWWDEPLLEGVEEVRKEIVEVLDDLAKKVEKKL